MNKKGSMMDFIYYGVYIFILSIVLISIYFAYNQINTAWQSTDAPPESKEITAKADEKFAATWDWIIALIVIGMFIGIVALAYLVRMQPVFAVISFLILVPFIAVAVYMSNVYEEFAGQSALSAVIGEFPLTTVIMQYYPHLLVVLGFVYLIVMYAKSRQTDVI